MSCALVEALEILTALYMYVCRPMCACIYLRICTHTHTHIYIYTHTHTLYVYTHTHTHTDTRLAGLTSMVTTQSPVMKTEVETINLVS